MENEVDIWPPAPANQPTQINLAVPKRKLSLPAFFLGFSVGITFLYGVWCAAYHYALSVGFNWQTELSFGLAAPDKSPAFLTGLGIGSVLLLLFVILFSRTMRDFSKGIAASYAPFGLLFLYILLMYYTNPKGPIVRF